MLKFTMGELSSSTLFKKKVKKVSYMPSAVDPVLNELYSPKSVGDLLEDHQLSRALDLDTEPQSLVVLCLRSLASNIDDQEVVDSIPSIPHFNLDLFHHLIPINIPLKVSLPVVEGEVYWKRCCEERWPYRVFRLGETRWKQLYVERHLQEYLDGLEPGFIDYKELRDQCVMVHPWLKRLRLKRLRVGRPRLSEDVDCSCPDYDSVPHRLDLRFVIPFLPQIYMFHVTFGFENAKPHTPFRRAELNEDDIERLGQAIVAAPVLAHFKVSSSHFTANDLAILYHYLNESNILVLEIEGCFLLDAGAQVASLLIKNHAILLKLSLVDNNIGPDGGESLAHALTSDGCALLKHLDLSLNPLGDSTGTLMAGVLTVHKTLEVLLMSGTEIGEKSGIAFGNALKHNSVLKRLDLSCNHMGRRSAEYLMDGLEANTTVEHLDVRGNGFHHLTMADITEILRENRDARRGKEILKGPKKLNVMRRLTDYLAEPKGSTESIRDPIPYFGTHKSSSLTTSDHGQMTLSTLDSTSTYDTVVSELEDCDIND